MKSSLFIRLMSRDERAAFCNVTPDVGAKVLRTLWSHILKGADAELVALEIQMELAR